MLLLPVSGQCFSLAKPPESQRCRCIVDAGLPIGAGEKGKGVRRGKMNLSHSGPVCIPEDCPGIVSGEVSANEVAVIKARSWGRISCIM